MPSCRYCTGPDMLVTKQQFYKVVHHFKRKYGYACRQPKKGEFYLKPTQLKGVFEVLQAENDFKRRYYPIVDERYLDYMKKHHLLYRD